MNTRIIPLAIATLAASAGAQQLPNVRPLGAVVATAKEPVGNVNNVRQIPGGRVLVNDITGRRVLLLDGQLGLISVIIDSTAATANAYSGRLGGLAPYRGDSTLFVDPQSLSMLMIDPSGKVGRTLSLPRAEDAMGLAGLQGLPGLDAEGRLVYRGPLNFGRATRAADGGFQPPVPPESLPIVRIDLATRRLDTLAHIKVPKMRMNVTREPNGGVRMTSEINPLPIVDEWAVTANGSLAIVRGQDYHVDWVHPDGSRSSSAKLPFEWQRLTDEDKVAFIDSVKAMRERMGNAGGAGTGGGVQMTMAGPPPGGGGGAAGEVRQTVTMVGPGGGAAGAAVAGRGPQVTFIPPSELPDYKPPFFSGSVRADAEGNLWIRTIPTKARPGGIVYDVVNGKGELVDRVQLPVGRTIVGFGPGTVYMVAREGHSPTATLEKASVR